MTSSATPSSLDRQALWGKYEDIAMHFNDLLMRLRSQSLAGIAAVSTLVGLFTKGATSDLSLDWLAATAIFIAMAMFWLAIWFLDFWYYNRLLVGAVEAIKLLESEIGKHEINEIYLSTTIIKKFSGWPEFSSYWGVMIFYIIVETVIVAGAIFSAFQYTYA